MSHACLLSSGEKVIHSEDYTHRVRAETYVVGELVSYFTQGVDNPPLGYNDFDFFVDMEPPRPDMDVKWDSRTFI